MPVITAFSPNGSITSCWDRLPRVAPTGTFSPPPASNPHTRSNTSVCLKIVDPWFTAKDADGQAAAAKKIADLLEKEGVALDIGAYRDAPSGLRIWGGATVENADMKALMPWLDWAWSQVKAA